MKKTPTHELSRLALLPFPLLALLCCLFPLFGCPPAASGQEEPLPLPNARLVDPPSDGGMLSANTYAGDAISAMLLKRMSAGSGLLSAGMVELDRLDQSSSFGHLAMQQLSSRVAQHGFRVIDVHLTEAMIINNNGEFMLSRDVCKILADKHNAYAVLVGTYTPAGNKLYVTVRALRLSDAAVIAAYEYYLPRSGEISSLLEGGPGGAIRPAVIPAWNRYAARGQSFPNCPPQGTVAPAARSRPAVSAPPAAPKKAAARPAARKAAPKKAAVSKAKKSPSKNRRIASRPAPPRAAQPQAEQPRQRPAYYPAQPEPLCPQDVPSNRRSSPDDCWNTPQVQGRGPMVYGDPYVDRGGGRVVMPGYTGAY